MVVNLERNMKQALQKSPELASMILLRSLQVPSQMGQHSGLHLIWESECHQHHP